MSVPIILAPSRVQGESYAVLDDALLIHLYNSLAGATFKVVARVLTPEGVVRIVQKDLLTTSDRSQQNTRVWLPSGQLLTVSVVAVTGLPKRGQSWAVVMVESTLPNGVTTLTPLAQGYVTNDSGLLWPGGPYGSSVEGPGLIRSVTGTDPAAGVEISVAVPTYARWKLYSLRATLVTDATVANRIVNFGMTDGAAGLMYLSGVTTQAGSLSYDYYFANYGFLPAPVSNSVFLNLPLLGQLYQGWQVGTDTILLKAGDNWGAPQMMVEEWIAP